MKMLTRATLENWLDHTAQEKTLVAPRNVAGVLLYRPISNVSQIQWDTGRPVLSAKEFFFPATERILTIEKYNQNIELTETTPNQPQILFGVLPCDARGIAALDAVFINTAPRDENYARRRKNSTIIGIACQKMDDTCFCTTSGSAPDDPAGMDIMLKEEAEEYSIRVLTKKGRKIVNDEWEIENCDFEKSSSQFSVHNSPFTIPDIESWSQHFNNPFWSEMAERCLSCRICAYVCPTCRCFDVRDEVVSTDNGNQNYERIRSWDSCAGEVYRRIAGGHNPRAEKEQRLRNRFLCKFDYFAEQYGPLGCTGCGRCIESCPVNIDITEVIEQISAMGVEIQ